MSVDPERTPVEAADINSVYKETVGLHTTMEQLRAKADELDGSRHALVRELREKARNSGLPAEAKLMAAALFRGPKAPAEMQQEITTLLDIDERVNASRGQSVMWLSSRQVVTKHRFPGPNEYGDNHTLHLGVLDNSAFLEVHASGDVRIPILKQVSVEIGKLAASKHHEHPISGVWQVTEPVKSTNPLLNIGAHQNLQEFPLFIGDAEVEDAFAANPRTFKK